MTDKKQVEKQRQLERQKAIWEAAKQGSKIAKKMAVIKGGKK
jgi:hypothetical protein